MAARSSGAAPLAELCAFLQHEADATKRRLARALHDSPAQTVSAALLTLFLLEREKGALSGNAQRALHDAQALLASCGEELRQLSHDLYPPLLDEVGLQPPLRALARQKGGERIHLHISEVARMPRQVEEAAYRFAEEALAGVLSARGRVALEVVGEGRNGLHLVIEGRARPRRPGRALALVAIEQRVKAAGGTLVVRLRSDRVRLEARFGGRRSARSAARK